MGVVYKAGLFTTICRFLLTKMATRPSGSSGSVGSFSDIRSSFSTKEGFYRRVKASEHSRPTRQPLFGKELSPVQISLVSCKGKEGVQEWIAFNSSKELYFYPFEGVGKVNIPSAIAVHVYSCSNSSELFTNPHLFFFLIAFIC